MSRDGPWTGASGRVYRLDSEQKVREGSTLRVAVAVATGEGGAPPSGKRVAVVQPLRRTRSALAAFEREQHTLEQLSQGPSASPAPRLFERLADDSGAVLEWCPTDLERWWHTVALEPDGLRNLCLALADVCRRVADHAAAVRRQPDLADQPPAIRPRSILRTPGGRWVLTGFGRSGGGLLEADDDAGTEMLTSASAFVAPEDLFEASSEHSQARQTWSIGACFFALLKVRALLASEEGARAPDLPTGGTDSPHLRSHRATLIEDLLQRKPALFTDRPLDPRQFLYPDRLPDRDRRTVAEALRGLFGEPQEVLEGQLAREILRLLDSALSIDPGRRYLDPLVMAGDLEGLARRCRVMRSTVAAARYGDSASDQEATRIIGEEDTQEEALPSASVAPLAALDEETVEEDVNDAATDAVVEPADFDPSGPVAAQGGGPYEAATAELSPAERVVQDWSPPPTPPVTPGWVKLALGGLALGQVLTLALVALVWFRLESAPPAAVPPTTSSAADLLEDVAAPKAVAAEPTLDATEPPAVPADTAPPSAAPRSAQGAEPAAAQAAPAAAQAAPENTAEENTAAENTAAPSPTSRTPSTGSAARTSAASSGTGSAPPQQAADAPTKATISLSGATGYLVGPSGRTGFGSVAPGSYTVMIEEGGKTTEAARVDLSAGDSVAIRCGFGQCRVQR